MAAMPGGARTRNLELERLILARPDDAEPFLVYADWLQQEGDPRGELAMVQAVGQHERERALLAARDELAGLPVEATWRLGWLQRVDIAADPAEVYDRLCGLDSARFLRELVVGTPGSGVLRSRRPLLTAVAERGLPFPLRRLVVAERPELPADHFPAPWAHLAGLEELEVESFYLPVPTVELPALRWLVIHGDVADDTLVELAGARLPRLERLALRLGDASGLGGLARLLAGAGMPSLCKLALTEVPAGQRVAEVLAASPLLPRLERLALPYGQLDDADGELFLRHRQAFARLRSLDLRHNYFNREMCARLAGLCPEVILDRQLPGEP
jgi:uncharacterized protein (TIGR02996 family)